MLQLTPFLLFEGRCAEAMTFYQTCFGGELTLIRLGDTPMKDGFPAGEHHKITYSCLKSDQIEFSATDWLHPTRIPKRGNTAAMYLNSDQGVELRAIFDKLADGANQEFFVDLRMMPFGLYGHFTDRYGVEWFFRGR
ncbi:MAG TPA: VOC family protein [Opitutaceae bacterium]|jgi:PhnB protein|nr:VOC family protein [Opitutaceae bacterium]